MTIESLSLEKCQRDLMPRSKTAYKQNFGHVLVVGSDYGMGGACHLAGKAALRSGAGLVSIATRPEYAFAMTASCPELMCAGVTKPSDLESLLARATVVVVGPGLGQNAWGKGLLDRVLKETLPLIVDADALEPSVLSAQARDNWILTPHPGEAARLLGKTVSEIQDNREEAIQSLHTRYQGTIVLKGANTLVLSSGMLKVCNAGNPGMATAGMGDVLAGTVAGLVAQQLSLGAAANLAVVAHATAGDQLVENMGERGLVASDILLGIQQCLNLKKV